MRKSREEFAGESSDLHEILEPERRVPRVVRKVDRERERLILKGERVLELCIEQRKVLCVQGFVDSQLLQGGDALEVVLKMKEYIDRELAGTPDRMRKEVLRELRTYLVDALSSTTDA